MHIRTRSLGWTSMAGGALLAGLAAAMATGWADEAPDPAFITSLKQLGCADYTRLPKCHLGQTGLHAIIENPGDYDVETLALACIAHQNINHHSGHPGRCVGEAFAKAFIASRPALSAVNRMNLARDLYRSRYDGWARAALQMLEGLSGDRFTDNARKGDYYFLKTFAQHTLGKTANRDLLSGFQFAYECYLAQGDHPSAMKAKLEKIRRLFPEKPDQGLFAQADRDFADAERILPRIEAGSDYVGSFYHNRGQMLARKGELNRDSKALLASRTDLRTAFEHKVANRATVNSCHATGSLYVEILLNMAVTHQLEADANLEEAHRVATFLLDEGPDLDFDAGINLLSRYLMAAVRTGRQLEVAPRLKGLMAREDLKPEFRSALQALIRDLSRRSDKQ